MAAPDCFWNQFTDDQLRDVVERRMKIKPGSLTCSREEALKFLAVPNPNVSAKPKVNRYPSSRPVVFLDSKEGVRRAAIIRSLSHTFLPTGGEK